MAFGIQYDPDTDKILIGYEQDESGDHIIAEIGIDREELLQALLEAACVYDDMFTVFNGKAPGDRKPEPTELTFLSPPTRDCILDDEEGIL